MPWSTSVVTPVDFITMKFISIILTPVAFCKVVELFLVLVSCDYQRTGDCSLDIKIDPSSLVTQA